MVFELLNQRGQIVKRLDAQLRSILRAVLWLGCSDRDQKAGFVPVFHLIRNRKAATTVHRTADHMERAAKQWMRRIAHRDHLAG